MVTGSNPVSGAILKGEQMEDLKSNFKALIDNELEHHRIKSDLLDNLEIFKIRFKEELSYFSGNLKESDLEIFYENRMIKIVFDNKYSRYGTNKVMKAVDGSLVFRVYIPDPCSEKDFDIVHDVIYNILGVAVI